MRLKFLNIITISLFISSCTTNSSTDEIQSNLEKDSVISTTDKVALIEPILTYDTLIDLIENRQQIPCDYIERSEHSEIKCPLSENVLIQESDNYIIIRSMNNNQALDSYPYYICSFSKKSAELIAYIPIGYEAEGVEPNTIKWKSNKEFTLINHSYDFVEDEESGAYMRGAVLDSTFSDYLISSSGEISMLRSE